MRNTRIWLASIVALCITSLAHGQQGEAFSHFFEGNCDEQRLIVELGTTYADARSEILGLGLTQGRSTSDTSHTFVSQTADIIVVLIVSRVTDRVSGVSVFMQRVSKKDSDTASEVLNAKLARTYNGGKIGESYRQECVAGSVFATVKPLKLGSSWYLSMTLLRL